MKLLEWAGKNRIDLSLLRDEDVGDEPIVSQLRKLDAENRAWLKQVVDKMGWPGKSAVGADGAHAAWLLVQHADRDPQFQGRCLKLMRELPCGEVESADIAFLTDRIRVAHGKLQVYGTQLTHEQGRIQLAPVEAPEALGCRRSQMGLPPIEEYLESARKVYEQPEAAQKRP